MPADYETSTDQMVAALNTRWAAEAVAIVNPAPVIQWQGARDYDKSIETTNEYWARWSRVAVSTLRSTLRGACGQRFRVYGFVRVQLFAPKSDARAWQNLSQLAKVAQRAHIESTADVAFTNPTIREIEPDEKFVRLNVETDFYYDELYAEPVTTPPT